MNEKLSLREIADWQLTNQDDVSLPPVQRGFVWKPGQIEALWDSLLRRFPIGSFLFSKTKDGKLHLLDGQQRATSIALGFYNPFTGKMSPWSIKKSGTEHLPVVWVDVNPGKLPKGSTYLLRVVTQSQPWGYDVTSKKLGISERRKALALFKQHNENAEKGYTQFANITYFPVEASYPVPLSFFFDAIERGKKDRKSVADAVISLCEEHLPPNMQVGEKDRTALIGALKTEMRDDLERLAQAALYVFEHTRINYDVLDDSVLMERQNTFATGAETEDVTLFVRINSSGTRIGGEELIYSIYKAAFPGSKDLVENIGMGFIAPTQIVSTAARMAYADSQGDSHYPEQVTVQRFQRLVDEEAYKNALTSLIGHEAQSPIREDFDRAVKLLLLEGVDGFKGGYSLMPPVLIKGFIKNNPDLFFLLVYWLSKNRERNIAPDLARRIAARLLTFAWFAFDKRKVSRVFWPFIAEADFWEKPITGLVSGEVLLAVPIRPELLREYYFHPDVEKHFLEKKEDRWGLITGVGDPIAAFYREICENLKDDPSQGTLRARDNFQRFIGVVTSCRSMLLFAQREYLNREFSDFNQLDDILEDTNTPWDLDHIYPQSWISGWNYMPPIIKEWNVRVGNLRALSLEDNRSENNQLSPAERLADEEKRQLSFVSDDWQYWSGITAHIDWDSSPEEFLRHYHAVVSRMLNIYKRWWDDLCVGAALGLKQ